MHVRSKIGLAVIGVLTAGILYLGCFRKAAPEMHPPLAVVNGDAITAQDFEFEVQRRLESGRPLGSSDAILEELIERRVMLQQAAESPLMEDPVVRRELENQKLVRWLDRTLQARKDTVTVSDEDLRRAYDDDLEAYTTPARIRLAVLYRRLGRHDDEARTAALRADLEAARDQYLADPQGVTQNGRIPGFGKVAVDSSEDTVSRYRGGDLGWLESGKTGYRLPDTVIQKGFSLPIGQPSEVLVAGDGLYIVMKSGAREARVMPFEEAVVGLRRRLLRERRERLEKTFKADLLAGADVSIDQTQAANLELHEPETPQPPALTPRGQRMPTVLAP